MNDHIYFVYLKGTNKTCSNAQILQDPFISPNNNPWNRIHFILQFDGKHTSAFNECSNAIIKVAEKQNDASPTEHMTNNAIFLIETVWEKIESKELLKELGCRMAFKGRITNKRQFTQLDGTAYSEDSRQLYDRTSAMKNPKTESDQGVKSSGSK